MTGGIHAELRPGTLRGLRQCASARGTFTVLALDHRQNLRRELRPDDPDSVSYDEMVAFKRAVVRALAPAATGTLLDPEIGAAQCIADGSMPASSGLLVAVEATGYEGPATARASRVLEGWSVDQAARMGASALKILLYYHPDAANAADQEALLAIVAEEARAHDLPLFVEPLSYSVVDGERLFADERRHVVIRTARRLTAIGGDILKAEFPYDPGVDDQTRWREACADLTEASAVPWVLLSGGVDDATFERQVTVACEAGASGVLVGRSVWAPAATLPPRERDAFLAGEGRRRLAALAGVVDAIGRPWTESSPLARLPDPPERWYAAY
jgi:tagatose-1,6-bisphosphate aldolase